MSSLSDRLVLKLMHDGPTLQQLTDRVSQEMRTEVPAGSVGEILVDLQNKGYAFLEEGRWWRTPEGVTHLDELLTEPREQEEFPQRSRTDDRRWDAVKQIRTEKIKLSSDQILMIILAPAVLLLKVYFSYASLMIGWDATVYLLNARRFLYGYDPLGYFELLRPPLLPFIVSLIWGISGENYQIVAPIQAICTVSAGVLLYMIIREMFDGGTALLSFLVFIFCSPEAFAVTNELLAHGIDLLFVLVCIYCAWKARPRKASTSPLQTYAYTGLIGLFAALASLTRYPSILFAPAVLILLITRDVRWNLRWIAICGMVFLIAWIPWLRWNIANGSGDPFASMRGGFSVVAYAQENEPWHRYVTGLPELVSIVGTVLFFIGIASYETFTDRKRLAFFSWFVASSAFFSSMPMRGLRFAIEWIPAIAVLIALGARRVVKRLGSRPRTVLNMLLALWLIYLAWNSVLTTSTDITVNNNKPGIREFPVIISWLSTTMTRYDIGAGNAYVPQLNYFSNRLFYSFQNYLEPESKARGLPMRELLLKMNVTYAVVTSDFAQEKGFDQAEYLVLVKKFEIFKVYRVVRKAGT